MAMFFPPRISTPTAPKERESRGEPLDPTKYDNWRPLSVLSFSTYSRGCGGDRSTASISALHTIDDPTRTSMLQQAVRKDSQCSVTSKAASSIGTAAPPVGWMAKLKYYYNAWGVRKFVPVVLLFFYSIAGAAMFYYIEHDNEQELLREEERLLDALRNSTMHEIRMVLHGDPAIALSRAKVVLAAHEKQLDIVRLPPGLHWDFWGALFYVGTLYTTIGYGNIFPRTSLGRALSVVYAIVGIPLVLAILSQGGRYLTERLSEWWQRRRWMRKKENAGATEEAYDGVKAMEEGVRMGKADDEDSESLEEIEESRTIPVSLALGLCIGWISSCAALFCLWERKWSYFTSLYFFCISLSTIGLGDVVPDRVDIFFLLSWLVIFGLCIVSMLLSVIQIKMEEWLYNFMVRMQKKYKEAMATGAMLDTEDIRNRVLQEQPWFMRTIAPNLLSEKQQHQIEQQAETYERVAREWNNKNIQTDLGPLAATYSQGAQAVEAANSMACDPISAQMNGGRGVEANTQWSDQPQSAHRSPLPSRGSVPTSPRVARVPPMPELVEHDNDDDSVSDAPSLPMDTESVNNYNGGRRRRSSGIDGFVSVASTFEKAVLSSNNNDSAKAEMNRQAKAEVEAQTSRRDQRSMADRSVSMSLRFRNDQHEEQGAQTDIAQFQIDEILLKLHNIQLRAANRSPPANGVNGAPPKLMERSVETTASILEMMMEDEESGETDEKGTQYDIALMDQSVLTDVLNVLHRSMEASPDQCDRGSQCQGERKDSGTETMLTETRNFGTMLNNDEYRKEILDLVDSGTDVSLREALFERRDAETQSSLKEEVDVRDEASSPLRLCLLTRSCSAGTTPPPERHPIATQTDEREMDLTELPPLSPTLSIASLPKRKITPTIVMETSGSAAVESEEIGTQMTPPIDRKCFANSPHSLSPFSPVVRSDSLQSLCGSLMGDDRQILGTEVVVQTDDSYLKIARRLDQYRSNRTSFLPVYAAAPLSPNSAASISSTMGPGHSRGYHIEPFKANKKSLRFSIRRKQSSNAAAQTSTSLDQEQLASSLAHERARSTSPFHDRLHVYYNDDDEDPGARALQRKASLPTGIPRGRVAQFVRAHERGVPNPGVAEEKKVTIIRQNSLGVGGDP